MATVNLNKLASALVGSNTKVRVRMHDGLLQIRPTDRKSAVGLPKGEELVDLREKKQAVRALRFTLPRNLDMQVARMYRAETAKHGWISMVPLTADEAAASVTPGQPKPAGASVSEK